MADEKRLRNQMKLGRRQFYKSCFAQYRDKRMKRMVGSRSLLKSHQTYDLFGQVEHSSDQGMLVIVSLIRFGSFALPKRRLFDIGMQRNCSQIIFLGRA